jgi:undecaprenyl diphosphate synthase
MDGNGRWATEHGLMRLEGHNAGVEAVRGAVRSAKELGVKYLTLYSFSSENWGRPKQEVTGLMGLLRRFLRKDLQKLHKQGVKIRIIGERDGVEQDILQMFDEAEQLTANNHELNLQIAFNYGSRGEIATAVRTIAEQVVAGELRPEEITEELVAGSLYTADIPDPDLIIRTSGEKRISNFLLWQAAYAEFVFLDEYWPDFDKESMAAAIAEYQRRERRFGK